MTACPAGRFIPEGLFVPPLDPDLHVKGTDRKGDLIVYTEKSRTRGIVYYRRMTPAEIAAYEESEADEAEVQPALFLGKVPT